MSVNNTNPGNLFGGVWSAWSAGRVPVGVAGSGTFDSVEKTGGAETHTLTTAQIPSHNHARRNGGEFVGVNSTSGGTAFGIQNGSYYTLRWGQDATTTSTGEGASHNNLQPYITCYMWKRVS